MDNADKIRFVKELVASVENTMLAELEAGKLPVDWDGIELREWVALRFDRERHRDMRDNRTKRRRDFKNSVLVLNI